MALLIVLVLTVLGFVVPIIEDDFQKSIEPYPPVYIKPLPVKKPCPPQCKQTCTRPNPSNCAPNASCSCPLGYVYPNAQNNTCIRTYECPPNKPCNGDKNAELQSPVIACPSTCTNPDQSNCKKGQKPLGCVCKSGYILSKPGGKCIKINKCPCGNPCNGGNRTYVNCKIACPINYCPKTDDNQFIPCDPVWPCPSGCVCKSGYKLDDGKCVLPQDCPPVTCTRPNEIWDSCPPNCYTDNCYDVPNWSLPCDDPNPLSCQPQCRCKPNFARGPDGICVPVSQCDIQCYGANEVVNPCPLPCFTDSCSDVPYRDAPCNTLLPVECVPRCECSGNYARADDGTCVLIDQCP